MTAARPPRHRGPLPLDHQLTVTGDTWRALRAEAVGGDTWADEPNPDGTYTLPVDVEVYDLVTSIAASTGWTVSDVIRARLLAGLN